MAIGVMTRIEDLNTVLSQTQDHRQRVLVAAAKNIKVWFIKVTVIIFILRPVKNILVWFIKVRILQI